MNADKPRMMPGQTPYTDEELKKLYRLVEDAADSDPGEEGEVEMAARGIRWR